MENLINLKWGFLLSLTGIILGWTLNQLSQWLSARSDDKKKLKLVLFNLLETYFIIFRFADETVIQKIADKFHSQVPSNEQTDESKQQIYSLYASIMKDFLEPELSEELNELHDNYQDSINALASLDPVTAYYLNGKTNVLDGFDIIQDWLEEFKQQIPEEQKEIDEGGKQLLNILKPEILADTLADLEKDIRKIAWKINPYVWVRSLRVIKRLKSNVNEKITKKIDELFDMLSPLMK